MLVNRERHAVKSSQGTITIQYNTYLIDRFPLGLFRANETQRNNRTQQQQLLRIPTGRRFWANQLAIYKCGWEVEPGTTRNKFNEWSERVLNPGSPDLKASALTTGPHCLHLNKLGAVSLFISHITFSRRIFEQKRD